MTQVTDRMLAQRDVFADADEEAAAPVFYAEVRVGNPTAHRLRIHGARPAPQARGLVSRIESAEHRDRAYQARPPQYSRSPRPLLRRGSRAALFEDAPDFGVLSLVQREA